MKKSIQRNIFKITLSVVMCLVICIVTMGSVPVKTYTAYIDPQLKTLLSTAKATDLIPIDIWLFEIDTDKIDDKVISKTGIGLASVKNEKTAATLTHAQIDSYIETERAIYAELQTTQSEIFLNKYSKIFSNKVSAESNLLFVSKYAPVIQAKLTPVQIATLTKDLIVESIYYAPEPIYNNDSTIANNVTKANYTRDTLNLTGTGIKVGILEYSGLPERGAYNIPSNKIAFDPDARDDIDSNGNSPITSAHATHIASILMGQEYTYNGTTYKGIVPNAMVYATFISKNEYGETRTWRECAEWLIGRGVNIINMSVTIGTGSGSYGTEDRWADHIALQHNVHLIKSAGNINSQNPNGYITSPGLACNVITVGNLNDKNTLSLSDDTISSSSAYIENEDYRHPNKPDIVAPGNCILSPIIIDEHTLNLNDNDPSNDHNNCSGTSFAAPYVTGIVTQLCQAEPLLKTNQAAVKSILCASATTEPHSYVVSDFNYDKYGAGLVNSQNAYNTVDYLRFESDYFFAGTEAGEYHTIPLYINSSSGKVKIALTWLNYKHLSPGIEHWLDYPVNTYTLADLDLEIYDSNENLWDYSYSAKGNVEIIELENIPTGTYTLKIINYSGSIEHINYSIAWCY